eukprot:3021193-Rhodomonas_salina.1
MLCASCNERLAHTNGFLEQFDVFNKWYYVGKDVVVAIKKQGGSYILKVKYNPNKSMHAYQLTLQAIDNDNRFPTFKLPSFKRNFTRNGIEHYIELPVDAR